MYLNIHFHYLINKINIIIFIILILLGVCFNVIPVITNNNIYFNRNVIYNEINNNNLLFFKLIYFNIISFIFGQSFNINNDSYHIIINNIKYQKNKYYFSKILILIIIDFVLIFSTASLSYIIKKLTINFYQIDKELIKLYFISFLISLIYGMLSIIINRIINSNISSFIPIMILAFGELVSNKVNIISSLYQLFFPIIHEVINYTVSYNTMYGLIHLLILLCIYNIISYFVYVYVKK